MKSKYPNQIDGSEELPVVRDNITEISSEVLNTLRSAVIQIQKTLGTNPHGVTGETVSSRLSQSLDEYGNILPSAISQAGLISGPIIDSDVSAAAGIKESKLNLDFPTATLQSEISGLNSELQDIITALTSVSATLAAHVDPTALNSHNASSINVDAASIGNSDVALSSIPTADLQATIEYALDHHIGYTGANISEENSSHRAKQIFFDNAISSEIISSNDVQGAIDDIASSTLEGIQSSLQHLASNGRVKKGKILDAYEAQSAGSKLLETSTVTFASFAGETRTKLTFSDTPTPIAEISAYDILRLSGSPNSDDNKDFQIAEVELSMGGDVVSITIFGNLKADPTSGVSATVYKSNLQTFNSAGLLCAARPRYDRSNIPDVVFINPNSATIISSGFSQQKVGVSSTFSLKIDGGTDEVISLSTASPTIDSVVNIINEYAVDNKLPVVAAKIRAQNVEEIVISHIVPNFAGDLVNRTLKITSATTELGFDSILGKEFEGSYGNKFFANGKLNSNPIKLTTFTSGDIGTNIGAGTLTLFSSNFSEYGIRVGDVVYIYNPSVAADMGAFRVGQVSGDTVTLDYDSFSFSDNLPSDALVIFASCSANIGEMNFEEISGLSGSILFDVFCDADFSVFYSKRIEISGFLQTTGFSAAAVDVSKGFLTSGEVATITVNTYGFASMTYNSQMGSPVVLGASGIYNIPSPDGSSFISLLVNKTGNPTSSKTITLYGFDECSSFNYKLSRGLFSTSLGAVLGSSSNAGIPSLIDKRRSGTVDESIISESFIEKYIEGTTNDLRSSGVIRDCEVISTSSASGYQLFSVNSGVVLSNGIRYEISGGEDFRINTSGNFYVAITAYGQIVAEEELNISGSFYSPFYNQNVVHLAYISSSTIRDLRFFVDRIDSKLAEELIVSSTGQDCHFKTLDAAIFYARNCRKLNVYNRAPIIKLRQGTYTISSQILVDFDLVLCGSGPKTILTRDLSFNTGVPSGNLNPNLAIFMIGGSSSTNSTTLTEGVVFRDFAYESNVTSGALTTFWLAQSSSDRTFRFENLRFIGPTSISQASNVGEFALTIGRSNSSLPFAAVNYSCGNIFITNCFFSRVGLESGCVNVLEYSGAGVSGMVASSNISLLTSPNEEDPDAGIIVYPTTTTAYNIVEAANAVALV